jgi:hypothetical protein
LRHVDSMNAETIGKVLDTTSDTIAKLAADNPVDRDLQRLHGAMANEFALTYQAAGDSEHALQSATASSPSPVSWRRPSRRTQRRAMSWPRG